MPKNKFLKIFELYYDITGGKPQIDNRPDVRIEVNSISSSLKVSIFINGYIRDTFPDYVYCLTNESAEEEFDINFALEVEWFRILCHFFNVCLIYFSVTQF